MKSLTVLLLCSAVALSGCGVGAVGGGTSGGRVYFIKPEDTAKIQFQMLDSINTLRQARGYMPMTLNAQLNAAAATHSRDMAVQNRPWHFGSDGSSPLLRVQRVGYTGRFLGEAISESNDTDLETLSAWMAEPSTRQVVLDPAANELGVAWYQEPTGKIWWTLVTGSSNPDAPIAALPLAAL